MLGASVDLDVPTLHVERGHGRIEHEIDLVLGIELGRTQWYPIVRRSPGEEILRKIRPVARRGIVGTQHRQSPVETFAAKHFRSRETRRTAPDDHDRGRYARRPVQWRGASRTRCGKLLAGKDPVPHALYAPARDRVQRGCVQCFAGTKTEAGVMPGTTHAVAGDDTVGERSVIVRA